MRSHKQTQASRANGAKGKGPRTAAGKANSAANANTHNLAGVGNLVLLSNESKIDFYNHQLGFIHRYQPVDIVEYDLVQKMITASWRLRRIEAMECALIEIEMDRQKHDVEQEFEAIDASGRQVLTLFGTTDASQALNLLLRYAAAASRAYASAYKLLKDLQGGRFNRPNSDAPAFLSKATETPAETPEPANADHSGQTNQSEVARARTASVNGTPVIQPTAISHIRRHLMPTPPATLSTDKHTQSAELRSEPTIAIAGRHMALPTAAAA